MHGLHPKSPKVVKLVHGLHQENSRVVELEVGLHRGCRGSNYRSPGVVKLEVGLHQEYLIREKKVSWGDKASDGASPQKMQESEVHVGTSPWESQGV